MIPRGPTLVIARNGDEAARAFVEQHQGDAYLVTPPELVKLGLSFYPGYPAESVAQVGDRKVPLDAISGVLCRLAWVHEADLPHVMAHDRAYVAAELSAFLLAWLTDLPCRVVNRATPQCLCGPGWRHEQWIHTAALLGLTVHETVRSVPAKMSERAVVSAGIRVTLVGSTAFGTTDEVLIQQTRSLADAARVELLQASFSNEADHHALLYVDLWPDVAAEQISTALWNLLN